MGLSRVEKLRIVLGLVWEGSLRGGLDNMMATQVFNQEGNQRKRNNMKRSSLSQ